MDSFCDEKEKQLLVEVEKDIAPTINIIYNCIFDKEDVYPKLKTEDLNDYIDCVARDNIQILTNIISGHKMANVNIDNSLLIPRSQPLPRKKTQTKWEIFAQKKNIKRKNSKETVKWDEDNKDWKPTYGYKRAKRSEDDWVMETPKNFESGTDPFQKMVEKKKEKGARNEHARLKNILKDHKQLDSVLSTKGSINDSKKILKKVSKVTRASTASAGRFQPSLIPKKKEAPINSRKNLINPCNNSITGEKEKYLSILSKVYKPVEINTEKAANIEIAQEQEKAMVRNKTRDKKSTKKMNRRK